MVHHHQLVMKSKFWSLSSHYGVEVEKDPEVQQSRGWACSEGTFGVTRWCCSPCPACGQ